MRKVILILRFALIVGGIAYISISREASGTSMSDGLLVSVFISQIIAGGTLCYSIWLNLRTREKLIEIQMPLPTEVKETLKRVRKEAILDGAFFFVAGLILTCGYNGMFMLQTLTGVWGKVIATGIQIPVILFAAGLLIKLVKRIIVNDRITDHTTKKVIFVLSLYLNFCLLTVDWRLGLFVFAIICGREIWLDTVFERGKIRRDYEILIKGTDSHLSTAVMYGAAMSAGFIWLMIMTTKVN